MKILSIIGTRPELIHYAPLSRALRAAGHAETLVNTGQHYDYNMAGVFLESIQPDHTLECDGTGATQLASIVRALAPILDRAAPELVLVLGDTNSTLAGALAAKLAGARLGHVEAGMRSGDLAMPEENSRRMIDAVADWLFAPSLEAVRNLKRENRTNVHNVGSLVIDAMQDAMKSPAPHTLGQMNLEPGGYLLATVHRAGTVDDPSRLRKIVLAMGLVEEPIVFPCHPRTLLKISEMELPPNVKLTTPVGYRDMLVLISNARMVLTDSGGIQQEAYYLGVPCVTLRESTEWTETVDRGWNRLAGTSAGEIVEVVKTFRPVGERPPVYGDGDAARKIVELLK